jgi:hypothetical protein
VKHRAWNDRPRKHRSDWRVRPTCRCSGAPRYWVEERALFLSEHYGEKLLRTRNELLEQELNLDKGRDEEEIVLFAMVCSCTPRVFRRRATASAKWSGARSKGSTQARPPHAGYCPAEDLTHIHQYPLVIKTHTLALTNGGIQDVISRPGNKQGGISEKSVFGSRNVIGFCDLHVKFGWASR